MDDILAGEIAGELGEEALGRIKSELDPGERLLWAGRPQRKPVTLTNAYLISGLLATIFFVLGYVFLGMTFLARLAPDEKPVGLAIISVF